jgi:excisionase family DNA binding protein
MRAKRDHGTAITLQIVLDETALDMLAARVAHLVQVDDSTPPEPWPEWMSVTTAAAYLDVPVERLRKLKERGRIPFSQEGRGCRVFFRRSDLDSWMGTTLQT